jgi:hypothetical protein
MRAQDTQNLPVLHTAGVGAAASKPKASQLVAQAELCHAGAAAAATAGSCCFKLPGLSSKDAHLGVMEVGEVGYSATAGSCCFKCTESGLTRRTRPAVARSRAPATAAWQEWRDTATG